VPAETLRDAVQRPNQPLHSRSPQQKVSARTKIQFLLWKTFCQPAFMNIHIAGVPLTSSSSYCVLPVRFVCTLNSFESIVHPAFFPGLVYIPFFLCSCSNPLFFTSILFYSTRFYSRYALPHRVIDAVSDHFLSFVNERRELPVLWHQSLLVFAQVRIEN